MKSLSQKILAEKLRLSATTVSRSLAKHPAIAKETRDRVIKAAEELGIIRTEKQVVHRRRSGGGLCVGVLVGVRNRAPGTATFPFILKGIHERAALENVFVDVQYQNPDEFRPQQRGNRVSRRIREGGWRGVVLIYPFETAAIEFLASRIPTVAALEDYTEAGIDSVDTDHCAGVARLVRELAMAGHRRIGFVAWDYGINGRWEGRRFGAYVEELYRNGLDLDRAWTFNVHAGTPRLSPAQIADAAAELVRRREVTAWVCAADHQAYQLIVDLGRRGIRVPADCSVTGYDGIEPPLGMPQLATARVNSEDIGGAAVVRLLNRITRPHSAGTKILLNTSFVAGETIAPPAVP